MDGFSLLWAVTLEIDSLPNVFSTALFLISRLCHQPYFPLLFCCCFCFRSKLACSKCLWCRLREEHARTRANKRLYGVFLSKTAKSTKHFFIVTLFFFFFISSFFFSPCCALSFFFFSLPFFMLTWLTLPFFLNRPFYMRKLFFFLFGMRGKGKGTGERVQEYKTDMSLWFTIHMYFFFFVGRCAVCIVGANTVTQEREKKKKTNKQTSEEKKKNKETNRQTQKHIVELISFSFSTFFFFFDFPAWVFFFPVLQTPTKQPFFSPFRSFFFLFFPDVLSRVCVWHITSWPISSLPLSILSFSFSFFFFYQIVFSV